MEKLGKSIFLFSAVALLCLPPLMVCGQCDHHDHHHTRTNNNHQNDHHSFFRYELEGRHLQEEKRAHLKDWCRQPQPSGEEMSRVNKKLAGFVSQKARQKTNSSTTMESAPYMISTHWFEIRPSRSSPSPYDNQESIDALNVAFADSGFQFTLETNEIIINANWYENVGGDESVEIDMKSSLRVGGAADLNIYMVDLLASSSLLGFATFPHTYASDPVVDGVVCQFDEVPGGPFESEGDVIVHEVGHWLGLYHTFNFGCDPSTHGDYVADTPLEANPPDGCPIGRDSCPSYPGNDPIDNFMDYSAESCRDKFTPGQAERMEASWCTFRSDECDPTGQFTPAPTPQNCVDCPEGWHDADGPAYDCAFYGFDRNCELWGDDYANFGATDLSILGRLQ